ncbi:MAG: T9SS type A sorting domain-containing protein [Ignavibacteria bacterium]|nr:T9SS type A sorting domain-containing protein [Ignavibacteria bacterium]
MKKILFLLILILISSQVGFTQGDSIGGWSLNFNNYARIYCGVINPINQNIMYIGGLDSGVYKTTNGGLNWFPINNGLTYYKVQAMDLCKGSPDVLYVGTDQNGGANSGIYRTTNGGLNWFYVGTTLADTSKAIQAIAVHPTNPDIVWICVFDGVSPSTVGLWKTTNGGANWFPSNNGIASDNKNMLSIVINPLNPNILYAGTSLILPGSTGPSKIYKSYDGGANWILSSNGLPTATTANNPVRALSISNADTSKILAALFVNDTTGGVYLSTNSGQSWSKRWGLPNTTGTLYRACLIRPGNASEMYVGLDQSSAASPRGVYRSTDGGNTWSDFSGGALLNTYTIRLLMFKTSGNPTLYAGAAHPTLTAGRGVFEYSWLAPPTIGWVEQTSPVTTVLNSVSVVNMNVAWATGYAGVVLRTTNGGLNWVNVGYGAIGTNDCHNICGIDANTALVACNPSTGGYIYRTSNGGANWVQVFSQTGGFVNHIARTGPSTLFMYGDPVGGRWALFKSTDNGVTWDSSGLYLPQAGSEAGWNNAMYVMGTEIWFGTNNTRVYYSTNLGQTWSYSPTTGSTNSYSITFWGNIGFTGQTTVLKTTNHGLNWTTFSAPGSGTAYSFVSALNRFWYARGSSVYISTDNGNSFAIDYTAPAGTIYHIGMWWNATTNPGVMVWYGYAVRSNGGISRYYNEIVTGVKPITNEIPKDFKLYQNYPNPFNPTTKIDYEVSKACFVYIKVYDVLGRVVSTLVNEYKDAGHYSITFDGTNLPSGVYFYKMEADKFSDTKRMLIIK